MMPELLNEPKHHARPDGIALHQLDLEIEPGEAQRQRTVFRDPLCPVQVAFRMDEFAPAEQHFRDCAQPGSRLCLPGIDGEGPLDVLDRRLRLLRPHKFNGVAKQGERRVPATAGVAQVPRPGLSIRSFATAANAW